MYYAQTGRVVEQVLWYFPTQVIICQLKHLEVVQIFQLVRNAPDEIVTRKIKQLEPSEVGKGAGYGT